MIDEKEAKKIATPLLGEAAEAVCVLSNGAAFVCGSKEDVESVKAFATEQKLAVHEFAGSGSKKSKGKSE